jgi:hypothetical protein
VADDRNFYKVEKWTKDGTKLDRLLHAGDNLEKAQEIFRSAIQHRTGICRGESCSAYHGQRTRMPRAPKGGPLLRCAQLWQRADGRSSSLDLFAPHRMAATARVSGE